MLELAAAEFKPGRLVAALELSAPLGELARLGALEREDRLLLVADREDRSRRLARTLAGGEFRHQLRDDLPLPRARVLRLVDQHVIDAEIELVMHPCGVDIGEQ